jgi:hypothetical protein
MRRSARSGRLIGCIWTKPCTASDCHGTIVERGGEKRFQRRKFCSPACGWRHQCKGPRAAGSPESLAYRQGYLSGWRCSDNRWRRYLKRRGIAA